MSLGYAGTRFPVEREPLRRVAHMLAYRKKESPYEAHIGCYVTLQQYRVPPTSPRSPNKDHPVFSKYRGGPPAWYTGR